MAVTALFFLMVPIFIIWLCQRVVALDKIGVVTLCFGLGIASSVGLDSLLNNSAASIAEVQRSIAEVAIVIALPLLVFSMNVKSALSHAGGALAGMALALFSIVLMSIIGAVLFHPMLENIWQIAGMSVGAYTGGGPNMAAIKSAINGDDAVFITMVTYDLLFSAVYLIFVITLGKRLFGLFLRPYQASDNSAADSTHDMAHMMDESASSYGQLLASSRKMETLSALLLSLGVVGVSYLVASAFPDNVMSTIMVVAITTLGLLFSLVPAIRKLTNSYSLGMYFVLVFCFTTGSMIDIDMIMNIDYHLAAYTLFILFGSLLLQAILCKLFKIDTDTFLITSSAAIMSVPFIPVIAGALKNREILLPGLSVAIIGYALGNYLGIFVANFTLWLITP
ncbi:Uncharacterised protein [Halioglobus japonicus]|nr:Uncharacterised protein [Halioglobus japonicus]